MPGAPGVRASSALGQRNIDWTPVITTAIAAGGSYLGQTAANEANLEEAERNRQFQERMSNTSYQRAVEDMRLAGINPMLAYMQGGASSPGGAMATVQDAVGPAVSSAMHGRRLSSDMKLARQTLENLTDQGQLVRDQAMRERMTSSEIAQRMQLLEKEEQSLDRELAAGGPEARVALLKAQGRNTSAAALLSELGVPGARNIARIEGGDVGQAGAWLRYVLQTLKGRR